MRPTRRDRALPRMHPIGLAALMALAGPAWALPQGATVVNGQVTIATPSPTLQVITQGSTRGIVDWASFSIASGEKVRIDQPSGSAVLLNRVTGQDPSQIFGQLQSNGRVFLLNPYGVVFGASARVDVGGLVASSLSLSNADFLAGRYALTSVDPNAPAQRGEVRNEGTIVAPGGFVALAGAQVANTGSIEATQGRVGLAAAQQVLVDVEGDGLIFFQTSASEAGNRLAQLGRIQADGGSVELRAAARGGFADTVLNMGGVVQARGLGLREGRVVIDGGDAGITRVAGSIDTSGAHGGHVEVTGDKVLLDAGAVLDGSGTSGGGTVLVGGNWQGQGPQRNAQQTHVDAQARIDVSATAEGDGGTAVVWADDTTRFYGRIAARGGEQGGDGGRVEVSGKRHLAFAGSVDARAPAGERGLLLLDPSNIRITGSNVDISPTAPFVGSEDTSQLSAATLVAAVNAANVTVDATGGAGGASTPGISVESAVAWNSGFTLTLKASGTINVGATIGNSGSGGLNLFTNGAVTGTGAIDLTGGSFTVAGTNGSGTRAASYSGGTVNTAGAGVAGGAVAIATSGAITTGTLTTTGADSTGAVPGHAGGAVTLTAGNGNIATGAIDTRGGHAGTSVVAVAGGKAGNITLEIDAPSAARQITLGTVTATGGSGSSNTTGNVNGGIGGAGGTVTVTNANGNVTAGIIDTFGGDGGDGNGSGTGGNGGAASAVAITAATGAVQVDAITATGGAVGDGDAPTPGARADITLAAGTNLTLTGALNAGTGSGTSTIALDFGQAGNGGTLDLTGAGTLSGNTVTAAGGASTTGDTLRAASNAATITLGASSLQLDASTNIGLTAVDAVDLTGGAGANTFVAGAWGGRLTVRASAGADIVQGNDEDTTFAGSNTGTTYTITAANTGSGGGTTLTNVGHITGGAGNDSFVFGTTGSLASVAGGGGNNTLDLSAKTGAVAIDAGAGTATGVGAFSGISTLVGNDGTTGGNTTLTGPDGTQTFAVSGSNAGSVGGIAFSGVGKLVGGSGVNTFALAAGGSLAGGVTGDGNDTLDLSARSGAVAIDITAGTTTGTGGFSGMSTLIGNDGSTGSNTTLSGGNTGQTFTISAANGGTITGGPSFSGVGNLAGGTSADSFVFGSAGSLAGNLAGGAAGDTLNLSAKSGAVTVNLQTAKSTGIGGTFSGIDTLVGNQGAAGNSTALIGSDAGLAFTLIGAGAGTAGGLGFSGVSSLAGGSGADSFGGNGSLAGSLADGGGATTLSGTLVTGGGQTYDGAVTLSASTSLASSGGGALRFNGTLGGNQTLALSTAGSIGFGAAVGAGTPLAGLSASAGTRLERAQALAIGTPASLTVGGTAVDGTLRDYFGGGTASAVRIDAGGGGTHDVTASGAGVLPTLVVSGDLSVQAGAALSQSGALTVAGTTQVIGGANAITLNNAGNQLSGAVSLSNTGANDVVLANGRATQLGTVAAGTGSLTIGSAGALTQTGAITQAGAGAVSLSAGAAAVTLTNAGNDFGGPVALTGSAVQIRDQNALTLAASSVDSLTVTANGAVTQSGALTVAGASSFAAGAGSITLQSAGNSFGGGVALSNTGAGGVALLDSGALLLSNLAVGSGTLQLTAGGAITQSGPVTQAGAGAVILDAGANAVTLTHAGNNFQGAVAVNGGAVSLTDQNALTLGASTLGSLTVDTSGAIGQTGVLNVSGASSFDAGNASIALLAANVFGGGVSLANTGANSVALNSGGALQISGATLGSGSFAVTAGGAITQSGAVTQAGAGAVSLDAGAHAITLDHAANDFIGAVSLANSGTNAVVLRDANALELGTLTLGSGTLTLTSAGNLTQSGAITQAAGGQAVTIAAGSGNVVLDQAGNEFRGAVTVSGGALSLRDASDLTVTAVPAVDASVSLVAAGNLALPTGDLDTGSADLTLGFATLGAGLGTLHGRNVSLTGSGGMALGNVTADGTLALSSSNAAITQQAGSAVLAAGATTVDAGSGDVVLANAGNDFAGVAVTGGAVSLRDQNALNVTALASGTHRNVSLVAGGALTTPAGAIDTGTADLVLSSGAAITTPGSLSGANLSLAGAAGLAIGSSLSASGALSLQTANAAITQSGGAISVAGTTSINAGSGAVTLAQAGNDFGGSVAVTGGAISLRDQNALALGAVQAASLDVTTTNGAVSQTAAATVSGSTIVDAGTGAVALTQAANRFARVAVTGGAVAIRDADALELGTTAATSLAVTTGGAITQSAAVRVGGASVLDAGTADVTLSNTSNDFGSVALSGAALTLADANDLTVAALAAGANRAVSLVAGGTLSLPLADIATGSAALSLASNGGQLTTRGAVSGQVVALTGSAGIVLGGDVSSATDQTYATAVTLATDVTLDAGAGRVRLQSGLAGAGHDLTVASDAAVDGNVAGTGHQTWSGRLTLTGDATLDSGAGRVVLADGAETGVHALTVVSDATLGGDVSGTGPQTFGGALRLSNDVALSSDGGRIALLGGVDGGGHALTLGSGAAAADAVRTGAALGNLSALTVDGRATLGGDVTTSDTQRFNGVVTLAADTTLDAGAGTIALQDSIDGGGHRLGLASSHAAADAIRSTGAIANAATLTVDGNIALERGVATSGAQVYGAALRLDADVTLEGASLRFAGTVDGARALTVRSADTRFGAAVGGSTALASLLAEGAGSTHIGAAITTSGAQTYANAVNLDADVTLAGSTLRFDGTIDGAQALTINGAGATTVFNAAVGQSSPLASLTVTGPATLAGGTVATSGAQRYDGAVTLAADTQLAGGTLALNGTLDGAHALALQFAGTSTLGGAVGGSTALASLSSSGAVALLAEAITTSGAQSYGSTLQLAGDHALRGGALSFAGAVSGARDLLLETDALAAGAISGSGTLHIIPRSVGGSIGIAGGAGDLQISQAVIDGAGSFARHVFGRVDGSTGVTAGAWTLAANTTLQSGSGELHLAGRVDGGFDLALNTGGITRIGGPIGTTTALRSLSTDNAAGAADWNGSSGEHTRLEGNGGSARIVTSGAQTYADPLLADVAVQFAGGAIVAEQSGNRFAAPVSAAAGSLVLRSADGLALGTLTLADGGRIETDGVLRLAGALQLDGGTLRLVSNATPTAVPFTDPALQTGDPLTFGFTPLREASATIVQEEGATLGSAAGSLLVVRSPDNGSILLDRAGNTLLGEISAVSGPPGDDSASRFAGNQIVLGFVRIDSSEIHAAGAPPAAGAPDPMRAGIEGDVLKLSADQLTTGPDGLLRARLPFLDSQGSQTSLPGLTLVMSPQALTIGGGFGTPSPDGFIRVRVGSELGGFLTVRPKGAGGENAVILLAGPDPKPFYDGSGKLTEVRVFYNGDAPRTPQETGALTAVTAIVEDARTTRFEEAVRTENVKSRLRSGVIAEVGSGRPATVGRESIRLPENCPVKANSLQCE